MKMRISPSNDEDKEIQLNSILDSFRTKFWIEEHQWFVRYYCYIPNETHQSTTTDLFTSARSTCPYDDEYLICDHVNHLYYGSSYFTSSISSHIHFPDMRHLSSYVSIDRKKNLHDIQSQLQMVHDHHLIVKYHRWKSQMFQFID
jgi:hypothetical protein